MTEKVPGLREQQKAATRGQLTQMGLKLFLTQGFSETTIEQIVAPLGIAKRTFFRYFKTKEDIVFAWYEEKNPELVEALLARPDGETPYRAVCETLATQLKRYDENPEWAWALVKLIKENASLLGKGYEKRLVRQQVLAEALIQREKTEDLSLLKAQILVGSVMTAFDAALDEWYRCEGKNNLRSIVENAFNIADAF